MPSDYLGAFGKTLLGTSLPTLPAVNGVVELFLAHNELTSPRQPGKFLQPFTSVLSQFPWFAHLRQPDEEGSG